MEQFIELRTSKHSYRDKYNSEIINCSLIRSVVDRPGYGEPMVTVVIDGGTKGHWTYRGANSIFKELHCYEVYDDLLKRLCGDSVTEED